MPPTIALIAGIVLVAWLLRIERQRNPAASHALWVPTLWLLLAGSRAVGLWFNPTGVAGSIEEGSAYDRFVLNMLILLAIWFLSRRKINWSLLLKNNIWLILLSVYLGLSVLWSDFMFVSFKRWIKIAGTVIMAWVILTETQPLQAMESLLRRCAYVLIPLSLVLIKYFPVYGILYTRQGIRMATGVATQKNGLGVLCALSAVILVWAIIRGKRSGELFRSQFHTIADVLVIGIALFLLFGGGGTSSATSILVFYVGIAFLLVLCIWKNLTEYVANHLKIFMVVGIFLFMLFNHFLLPMFTSFLSRDETLTGRTDIWRSVLEVAARKPILGTGYGGYWGLQGEFDRHYEVGQSHNGYLDVYLQVGIVGLAALFMFFLEFCGNVRRELNHVYDWGMFGICFITIMLLYNYSEASFIVQNYMWTVTVFLSVVFSVAHLRTNVELIAPATDTLRPNMQGHVHR